MSNESYFYSAQHFFEFESSNVYQVDHQSPIVALWPNSTYLWKVYICSFEETKHFAYTYVYILHGIYLFKNYSFERILLIVCSKIG